jgi:predicted lipid-binding transport protein (Tim44 family)
MKRIVIALFALVMSAGFGIETAEAAKRLGGGKSVGAQRSVDAPKQSPTAAPAQQAAPAAAPGAAAAAKPGMGRWLAPLAGLAAGLGLAALFGDELAPFMGALLVGLLIAAAVFLLMRVFGRRPQAQTQQGQLQYAGLGRETVSAPPPSQPVPAGAFRPHAAPAAARVPAGFDVAGFTRQAKKSFLDLQAANDSGDVSAIRDFATDEMFALLKQDIESRGPSGQRTDVMTLDADLLEVVTEGSMHWASVRFSGMIREEQTDAAQPFEEIWNLQKPADGSAGWMLAGIQQVQ